VEKRGFQFPVSFICSETGKELFGCLFKCVFSVNLLCSVRVEWELENFGSCSLFTFSFQLQLLLGTFETIIENRLSHKLNNRNEAERRFRATNTCTTCTNCTICTTSNTTNTTCSYNLDANVFCIHVRYTRCKFPYFDEAPG